MLVFTIPNTEPRRKAKSMRRPKPIPVQLTPRQRAILEQFARRATGAQREVLRAKIVLALAERTPHQAVARRLGVNRETVQIWRARWQAAWERLTAAEGPAEDKALQTLIRETLDDEPRRGRPATFTAEQICHIVAVACEEPEQCGRPVTHWTPAELADEVIKREIVAQISPRSVGRFLKGGRFKTPSIPVLAESRARGRSGSFCARGEKRV